MKTFLFLIGLVTLLTAVGCEGPRYHRGYYGGAYDYPAYGYGTYRSDRYHRYYQDRYGRWYWEDRYGRRHYDAPTWDDRRRW
jgi:hypothetical protein